MAINPLWYPADFTGQGEELTVLDAIDRINNDAIELALSSQVKNREIYWDIIHNQNITTLKSETVLPFTQVGSLPLPPIVVPPSPPPNPTILVTPMDARSIDVEEGKGGAGGLNGSQAIRIIITALNDDLTIYGVLLEEREFWDLKPDVSKQPESNDPLFRLLDIANVPIVIPKNTWKAINVSLNPRANTVNQTEPVDVQTVVFILSNAVNTYHSNQGEELIQADNFFNKFNSDSDLQNIDRRYFDNYIAVRLYGRIIPDSTSGGNAPSDPRPPVLSPAPYPGAIPLPPPPEEEDLGTRGYTIAGTDLLLSPTQTNRTISFLDFKSETIGTTTALTEAREWCGVVGNQSQFYVAGGSSNKRLVQSNSLDRFDMFTNAMSRLSLILRSPVDMLAGATVKDKGYLFGGDALRFTDDGGNVRYGSLDRIERMNLTTEFLVTTSSRLPSSKSLTNCATGNARHVWLFGGGRREASAIDTYLFAHDPVTTITEFDSVGGGTINLANQSLATNNCWRNASAGNRDYIYISGGCTKATDARTPAQSGLSSRVISRFNIATKTVLNAGTQLDFATDAHAPMGGSKKIYFAGGFSTNGYQSRTGIQKLDNLGGAGNETITTITTNLTNGRGASAGISDYSAGL